VPESITLRERYHPGRLSHLTEMEIRVEKLSVSVYFFKCTLGQWTMRCLLARVVRRLTPDRLNPALKKVVLFAEGLG